MLLSRWTSKNCQPDRSLTRTSFLSTVTGVTCNLVKSDGSTASTWVQNERWIFLEPSHSKGLPVVRLVLIPPTVDAKMSSSGGSKHAVQQAPMKLGRQKVWISANGAGCSSSLDHTGGALPVNMARQETRALVFRGERGEAFINRRRVFQTPLFPVDGAQRVERSPIRRVRGEATLAHSRRLIQDARRIEGGGIAFDHDRFPCPVNSRISPKRAHRLVQHRQVLRQLERLPVLDAGCQRKVKAVPHAVPPTLAHPQMKNDPLPGSQKAMRVGCQVPAHLLRHEPRSRVQVDFRCDMLGKLST